MQMIEFDNKKYYLDLDKLMEWCVDIPAKERNNTVSVTCVYGFDDEIPSNGELDMIHKEESEVKNDLNDTTLNFRYDLMKNLITVLFTAIVSPAGTIIPEQSLDNLTLQQSIAFNTLIHMNILVEYNGD